MRSIGIRVVALATAVAVSGCGGSPSRPSVAAPDGLARAAASGGSVSAMNTPPRIAWKTTPRPDMDTLPYPTVSGAAPLRVRFNLCESRDAEQVTLPDGTFDPSGDFINWQFHFGDTAEPAFNEDGSFNPDYDHFCRVEHVYGPGRYVATMSVTDRQQGDQSHDVASLARVSTQVTIEVFPEEAPRSDAPVIVAFTQDTDCDESTLVWRTVNATSVTLSGLGTFAPNGSVTREVTNGIGRHPDRHRTGRDHDAPRDRRRLLRMSEGRLAGVAGKATPAGRVPPASERLRSRAGRAAAVADAEPSRRPRRIRGDTRGLLTADP